MKTKTKGEAPFHSAAWREPVLESKSINVIIFDDASDALAYVLTFP